jgi:hypothetical protein
LTVARRYGTQIPIIAQGEKGTEVEVAGRNLECVEEATTGIGISRSVFVVLSHQRMR